MFFFTKLNHLYLGTGCVYCFRRHGDKESHNFVKCGPIVAKLYMEMSWYNTDIVKKYQRNRYNVKVTQFVENT